MTSPPMTVLFAIRRTLDAHRAQALQATEVRVTSDCRRVLLRECGLQEDRPWQGSESAWGVPLVLDDSLPEDPGFAVLTVQSPGVRPRV